MYTLSFGRWSHKAGCFLIWDRIYYKGYEWTLLCKLRKRYKSWLGYWGR